MQHVITATALALCLAGCSSEPSPSANAATAKAEPSPTANAATPSAQPAAVSAAAPDDGVAAAPPPMVLPVAVAPVLGLDGLDDLRIGEPVPKGGSWAERGAQVSDLCRIVSSPDYPGVYAIVETGKVRRITVGERSNVVLAEGIGVGTSEAEVKRAFPGFRADPHAYEEAPAKYLTAPGADSGEPALRFEIGRDGRVSLIHVGTMPVLGYVEGCA
ncbi:hypothetical protein [Novosphingobium malaysiense]|uniref:Uncharacterized protein n=1 Tax=Novosphingobium malaysiense TaxID=1348853 RepID=A0A0B1ZHK9_9SPHN|nr:hypothetical protein [Novosphingobium malaysiense]KHK89992.1 hypothetical protein LK12_19075 [Novosphingobium malaysiense]